MPVSCQRVKTLGKLTITGLDCHLIENSYMTKQIKTKNN